MSGSSSLRRPGRIPGAVNLAVAVATLIVLIPLLLNAGTVAPPTAAEFSPNADQVIKKAPPDQAAAVNGTGEGSAPTGGGEGEGEGGGPGGSTTTSIPKPPDVVVPANQLKRCVGPPPLRQIEDPQSPPCIAFYQGDNGGATAKGVTKDAVYIAVPTVQGFKQQYTALQNFFNNRFQFYGRKIVLEFCDENSGGGSGSGDQPNQVADAQNAAAGCADMPPPFASTMYRTNNGAYYMPEIGCNHKVIAVGSYSPFDKKFLERCPGYQFQYPMEVDEQIANVGEWMCNRVVGRNALYSGTRDGQSMAALPRKIGVFLEPFTDPDPVNRRDVLNPMVDRVRECNGDMPEKDIIVNPVMGIFDPATAQNAVTQLKNDGVTSIVCYCNFFSFGTLARAADGAAYQPEWITNTFGLNDVNSSFTLSAATQQQLAHTFGLTFQPKMLNPLKNPYTVAVQEGDPTVNPDTTQSVEGKLEDYRALLLIASGIQMAGPKLTPETFRDGLRRASFPNPKTDHFAGDVDFRPDGYSMTADGAEWWYSTRDTGVFSDSSAGGTVCYIANGARHKLGRWPKGDAPFFQGPCDSGTR